MAITFSITITYTFTISFTCNYVCSPFPLLPLLYLPPPIFLPPSLLIVLIYPVSVNIFSVDFSITFEIIFSVDITISIGFYGYCRFLPPVGEAIGGGGLGLLWLWQSKVVPVIRGYPHELRFKFFDGIYQRRSGGGMFY